MTAFCPVCKQKRVFWSEGDTRRICIKCPWHYQRKTDIRYGVGAVVDTWDNWYFTTPNYEVFVYKAISAPLVEDKHFTYTIVTKFDKDCIDCNDGECNIHNIMLHNITIYPCDEEKLIGYLVTQ